MMEAELLDGTKVQKFFETEQEAVTAAAAWRKRVGVKLVTTRKVGRNELCPCESGLKFKRCCISKISARCSG